MYTDREGIPRVIDLGIHITNAAIGLRRLKNQRNVDNTIDNWVLFLFNIIVL